MATKSLLTVQEAASKMHKGVSTVYRMLATGELKGTRRGNEVFVKVASLPEHKPTPRPEHSGQFGTHTVAKWALKPEQVQQVRKEVSAQVVVNWHYVYHEWSVRCGVSPQTIMRALHGHTPYHLVDSPPPLTKTPEAARTTTRMLAEVHHPQARHKWGSLPGYDMDHLWRLETQPEGLLAVAACGKRLDHDTQAVFSQDLPTKMPCGHCKAVAKVLGLWPSQDDTLMGSEMPLGTLGLAIQQALPNMGMLIPQAVAETGVCETENEVRKSGVSPTPKSATSAILVHPAQRNTPDLHPTSNQATEVKRSTLELRAVFVSPSDALSHLLECVELYVSYFDDYQRICMKHRQHSKEVMQKAKNNVTQALQLMRSAHRAYMKEVQHGSGS